MAEELGRFAGHYRDLQRVFTRARDTDIAIDLSGEHIDLGHVLERASNLGLDLRLVSSLVLAHDLRDEQGVVAARPVFLDDLVSDFDRAAAILRRLYAGGTRSKEGLRGDELLLSGLARLLPESERARFVAEAHGNLGDCEHWWQRVDQLVCLALGMPRLAWMMWRGGRRGRV